MAATFSQARCLTLYTDHLGGKGVKRNNTVLMGCIALLILAFSHKAAGQAPNIAEYKSLGAYVTALNQSTDPQSVLIRREIADGPAELAREKAECVRRGITLTGAMPDIAPDQNALPLYQEWNAALRPVHKPWLPNYAEPLSLRFAYTRDQLDSMQKLINDNSRIFGLLHRAAEKPYLVAPSTNDPVYAQIREAARELTSEGFSFAHRGEYSKAISVEALGLNIANQTRNGSGLGGYLQGADIETYSLQGFQDIITMAGPNQKVDEQIEEIVRKSVPTTSLKGALTDSIPKYLKGIDSERSNMPQVIGESMERLGVQEFDEFAYKRAEIATEQRSIVSDLADAAEARYLKNQLAAIDATQLHYSKRTNAFIAVDVRNGVPVSEADVVRVADKGWYFPFPEFTLLDKVDNRFRSAELVTLAAAAILKEKAVTGQFPQTLPGTYIDPFSGESLKYHTDGKVGFVLYSVGPTGLYDGKAPMYREACYRYPEPPTQPLSAWMLGK